MFDNDTPWQYSIVTSRVKMMALKCYGYTKNDPKKLYEASHLKIDVPKFHVDATL